SVDLVCPRATPARAKGGRSLCLFICQATAGHGAMRSRLSSAKIQQSSNHYCVKMDGKGCNEDVFIAWHFVEPFSHDPQLRGFIPYSFCGLIIGESTPELRGIMKHLKVVCIAESTNKLIIDNRNDIDVMSLRA